MTVQGGKTVSTTIAKSLQWQRLFEFRISLPYFFSLPSMTIRHWMAEKNQSSIRASGKNLVYVSVFNRQPKMGEIPVGRAILPDID
jgi:hypothetical protein